MTPRGQMQFIIPRTNIEIDGLSNAPWSVSSVYDTHT